MSTPPKRNRVIRVEDDLWEAAKTAAEERHDNLSEEIRRFLLRYIKRRSQRTPPLPPERNTPQ